MRGIRTGREGRSWSVTVSSPAALVVVVLVFVGLVGVGVVLPVVLAVRAVTGADDPEDSSQDSGRRLKLLTADGYTDLVSAIERQTRSAQVFSLTVYANYAVIDVPVDETSQRKYGWSYDGEWQPFGGPGTSSEQRFRADRISGELVVDGVRRAKAQVEDPTNWYVIVAAPRESEGSTCLTAYAANKFNENAMVRLRCDGSVVPR